MRRTGSAIARRKLLGQVIGERRLRRHEGLEIVVAVLAPARADAGPFRIGGGLARRRTLRGASASGKHVLDAGVEGILDRRGAVHVGLRPFGFLRRRRLAGGLRLARLARLARALAGALQQRIALEFAFHIGRQIEIGELQQLDGLHQLRRHHERLALPEFESLRERHVAVQYWSGSCLSVYWLAVHPVGIRIAGGVNNSRLRYHSTTTS